MVAAQYLTKASKKFGDSSGVARGWHILGRSALLDRELEDAGTYLRRAVKVYGRSDDPLGLAEAWTDVGILQRLMEAPEQARFFKAAGLAIQLAGGNKIAVPDLDEGISDPAGRLLHLLRHDTDNKRKRDAADFFLKNAR